jgi:hypothetical protein
LNLRTGEQVDPDSPSEDLGWDLSFDGTILRTNGGSSGSGEGGALAVGGVEFGDVEQAPAEGYADDSQDGSEVLAGWFESPTPDEFVPTLQPFVVRTADGGFAKLQITSFDGGTLEMVWVYAGAGRDSF